MKINNLEISRFGAELIEKIIYPSDFENKIEYEDNMPLPFVTRDKFKLGLMELGIVFKSTTEKEMVISQSNFNIEISRAEINFKQDSGEYEDLYYVCVLSTAKPEEAIFIDKLDNKYTQKISYQLTVTEKKLPEVIKTMEGTTITFNADGNRDVPAIVEITPTLAIASLKITGLADSVITVKNLVANKTVVFRDGMVTVDGVNKFNDCDLWEFPRVRPGNNVVTIDKTTAKVAIKYNPRFK